MDQSLATTLFDLLARSWIVGAPVIRCRFDAREGTALFLDADGGVALASLAHSEDAQSRIRVELQTGRTTIRPRQGAIAPLIRPELAGVIPEAVAALGDLGFALGLADGSVQRLTPRGQIVRLRRPTAEASLGALAADPAHGLVALAEGDRVTILDDSTLEDLSTLNAGSEVSGLAFLPDGTLAAVAGPSLWLLSRTGEPRRIEIAEGRGAPEADPSGAWLAGTSAEGGLWLAEIGTGRTAHLRDYPLPPQSIAFSLTADTLVTSGAFRLASWSLRRPPFDGDTSGALSTGKASVVAVTAAAAHPTRDLVAVGRASGELVVARIGHPEEMLLRLGGGDPILALAWSSDGRHLAVGTQGGTAALVEFPSQIFK